MKDLPVIYTDEAKTQLKQIREEANGKPIPKSKK